MLTAQKVKPYSFSPLPIREAEKKNMTVITLSSILFNPEHFLLQLDCRSTNFTMENMVRVLVF